MKLNDTEVITLTALVVVVNWKLKRRPRMITEDQLEQLALDWFRGQGYDYVYGPNIAPDGGDPERGRTQRRHDRV